MLNYGYILVDWIETDTTRKLSSVFSTLRTKARIENLCQDMSRIILSLSKCAQFRIGSWTIDNNGHINLSNRPIPGHLLLFEDYGVTADIPREMTYRDAASFFADLTLTHDNSLLVPDYGLSEKNANALSGDIIKLEEFLYWSYDQSSPCKGPFVMQFTDMHIGKIFVDEDWHIKYITDLDFACSLPLGTLLPPWWWWWSEKPFKITLNEKYDLHKIRHKQFMEIFDREEKTYNRELWHRGKLYSRAAMIAKAMDSNRFWYGRTFVNHQKLYRLLDANISMVVSQNLMRKTTYFAGLKCNGYAGYIKAASRTFNTSGESGLAVLTALSHEMDRLFEESCWDVPSVQGLSLG